MFKKNNKDIDVECCICEETLKLAVCKKLFDGFVCKNCLNKQNKLIVVFGFDIKTFKNLYEQELNKLSDKTLETLSPEQKFKATKILSGFEIDHTNKLIKIKKDIYNFENLLDFELIDDSVETSKTKKKGGVSRAVAGGLIAGPVGAIVGSSTAKQKTTTNKFNFFRIKLVFKNSSNSTVFLNCSSHKDALKKMSEFTIIEDINKSN
ncbi:MAG: hypothetical protein R3Y29_03585 [bacterium]